MSSLLRVFTQFDLCALTANDVNDQTTRSPKSNEVATEEIQVMIDCVAVYYEEGKGGENFRKKNRFRCRVNKDER